MSFVHKIPLSSFASGGQSCAPDQFKLEIEKAQQAGEISRVLIGEVEVDFSEVTTTWGDTLSPAEISKLTALANDHTAQGLSLGGMTPEGYPITAPTWERTNLDPVWKGYFYTPTPKASEGDDAVYSMFDELITDELLLRGGWYTILEDQANVGDFIEFSIVDKDDALGMFAGLGLTVGQDILELAKFVRTEYVSASTGDVGVDHDFTTRGGFRLVPGVYMRTTYVATGTSAPKFKIRLEYQE